MSSNRRRLGVAVILDPPLADEIDGLRRAVGDPSLGRIPPHVTLVPPVNVRGSDLPLALDRLRTAAAGQHGPLRVTFGSVGTFLPVNPVLYLAVGGDLDRLRALRDSVFAPPLERKLSWPWVPHLTLADGATEERIAAALQALDSYAVTVDVDRVVLLEEDRGRIWRPLADATLGPASRVGTGGLPLELTTGRLLDPEAATAAAESGCPPAGDRVLTAVVTARREGQAVGTAAAWTDRRGPHVAVWVRPEHRRQGIGAQVLAHLEFTLRRAGWEFPSLTALGPAVFYRAVSRWSVPDPTDDYSKATEE